MTELWRVLVWVHVILITQAVGPWLGLFPALGTTTKSDVRG